MTASPARTATIKATGTPTTMTAEACSLVSGETYQITNTAKRAIDPASALTVYDAGSPVAASNISQVDLHFGRITFVSSYTVSGAVTVTGKYLPLHTIGHGQEFSLTVGGESREVTPYGSSSRTRAAGLITTDGYIARLGHGGDVYDGGSRSPSSLLRNGERVVFEIGVGGSVEYRTTALVDTCEDSAQVGGLIGNRVSFVGTFQPGPDGYVYAGPVVDPSDESTTPPFVPGTLPTADLVTYYLADTGSGTTDPDTATGEGISDGNLLFESGATTWDATANPFGGVCFYTSSTGNAGATVGYEPFGGGRTEHTWTVWTKRSASTASGDVVFCLYQFFGLTPHPIEVLFSGAPTITLQVRWNSGAYSVINGGSIAAGSWGLVAVSFDVTTSTVSLYVNGALVGSDTKPGDVLWPNSSPILSVLRIGGDGLGARGPNCHMWEVSTWKTVLDATEHLEVYNRGINNVRLTA